MGCSERGQYVQIRTSKINQIESIENREDKIHAAAIMYVELGIRIVPIRPNSKALPSSGVNYQSASRKPEIINRWFGVGGKYRGWNIGIACGQSDGVAAIDIDNQEEWERFSPDNYDFDGPVQRTPSGGTHMLVKWTKEMRSSTSHLATGIDTRGGDDSSCKSHIVVWPSEINGIPYEQQESIKLTI